MARTKLGAFCDKLIEAGWLAAILIVPIFFNVYSSRVFEPDKITILRSIVLVMIGAWAIKMVEEHVGRDQNASGEVEPWWKQVIRTPLALPTFALVLIYVISTLFSVVPRVSLLGSYQRLQGTYSMMSYIVVFAMMLQGVRSRDQVERFVTTIVLTSVPVALYAILQHYGLDPLPWGGNVRYRVAANMGNAIFIAAYMIMALPLTLYRTVESFTEILTSEKSRPADIVLGAAYVFVLAIQAICIFFSKSRGPLLGLIGGLFFFFLVLAVVRRWRGLVWGSVIAIGAVIVFLVVFNMPSSPLEGLRTLPYIGRLGQVLDPAQTTSKVRLLIWQGAIEMISPHPPLQEPDGTPDAMNVVRPLIGYGPESMYVAYNRFYPPDLAHYEARNASPDRSHNETFDSLVITGLLGFAVYMWLFTSVFFFGFQSLGVIANKLQRNLFMGCWFGGGILGATAISAVLGTEFVGVGLPAGLALGLGLYLVLWGLGFSNKSDDAKRARAGGQFDLLMVALVAAVIAHFVEIHFGIAIAATRTYFWSYVGLLVVVGYLLPRLLESVPSPSSGPDHGTGRTTSKRSRRRRRSGRLPSTPKESSSSPLASVLPYALILALIMSTMAYNYVSNQKQLDSPQEIVWTSLTRRLSGGELVPSFGILAMFIITWVLGAVIVVAERVRSEAGENSSWQAALGACLSISVVVAFVFALIIAGRLAGIVRQGQLLDVTQRIMGILTSYYVLVGGLMVAVGWAMTRAQALPERLAHPTTWWFYPVLLVGVVLLVVNSNLEVVHADISYKQAEPYERQDMWDFSVVLHQQAIRLAPQEDFYYLFLGRAFLEKAKAAPVADEPDQEFTLREVLDLSPQAMAGLSRADLLNCSDAVLQRARKINPLNTDHSANLGRLYRTRAELSQDAQERQAYFDQALEYYQQAISLSPNAAHLYNEWGAVYAVMGDYERALSKYETSLSIDAEYVNTYLSLGDTYMALDDLDQALDYYLKAVDLDPRIPEVHSVLSYVYGQQGRLDEAIAATRQVLDLTEKRSLRYTSYKNLALFYRQQGRTEEAIEAAQQALSVATDSERASIQGLIQQLSGGQAVVESGEQTEQLLAEGEAALNAQEWERAASAYEKALATDPNLLVAHSALAYIYAQQGRLQEAAQENHIVLAAVPGDLATLKNLAIIYRQLGQLDDAIEYAQQAAQSPQVSDQEKQQLQLFIQEVEEARSSG